MNIAPYALARIHSWQLPDIDLCREGSYLVEVNPVALNIFQFLPGLREVPDLRAYDEFTEYPVGLFRTSLTSFAYLTSELDRTIESRELPRRFVRTLHIREPDMMLWFPDDIARDPNISFFVPSLNDRGEIVFRAITLGVRQDMFFQSETILSNKDGCTLSASGELPERRIRCTNTGCPTECKRGVLVDADDTNMLLCECKR